MMYINRCRYPDLAALWSIVCLLPSFIEIGVFPVLRSSLTHSSLLQANEDERSSEGDNEHDDEDKNSDDADGEDKVPV